MESLQENIQSSTIIEMLNSTCLLLDKKLSMIQLLCTRECYSKLCDHNVIIKWVADILPTLSFQDALKVYNCLNVCLKGNIVPPANGKVFFKMLLSCFMLPNIPQDKQVSSAVRGCLMNILHKPYFREILKYDISDLSTCVEVYLVTFSFSGVDGRVSEIFSVIRSMYKSTLLKSSFVEEFVESMLPNIFTFIQTDKSYTQQIDFCFQQVLFPDAESASKYLQAFKNYNPDGSTASNQYESLVKLIVRTPFICGSPMLSGKFYELFCRRFIAYCKSHLIMTYELFTFLCLILGCKPNVKIPLSVETNDYNKELSLHSLNSVLVTIQESSQITRTLNMGRSVFVDYITALVDFIVSKSSETCAEFYNFVSNIVRLIPSFSEGVFRKALSVVLLRHKDTNELECYVKMLAEVLKMYSKFYNLGKFVTHLCEETVKALVIAKDNCSIEWECMLPSTFLTEFEHTAVVMGTDHLCRTLDVVNTLLMDCIAKIQNQEDQTAMEACNFVLQCEMLGKFWCRLFINCEMPSMGFQSRRSIVINKVLESMEMAGKVLTIIGKLLLTARPNSDLMSMFLNMSYFWGHASFISDRISKSAVTDVKDLSILCDFLDAQEWAKILNIVTEIGNQSCQTLLTDLLLINLWCLTTTSDRVKKDLIQNILSTASVEWLLENYNYLLESATPKQLAIICERFASEDSIDVLLRFKSLSVEKLSQLRITNFFLSVYIMKAAGKLLSAEGRNLTSSVSSLLTTEFLLVEVKRRYVTRSSTSSGDVAESVITTIADRIHESRDGQCQKRIIGYLDKAFELLQGMSLYSLERHLRLSLFCVILALCKDLEKNKLLQDKAFSLMLDVLVGSCRCQKNMQGPCSDCGNYLHLPGKTDYSSILKWIFLESKEHENHIELIEYLCGTISRDADLTERTVDSLQSNLELICSFHQVLGKSAVPIADGSVIKKRKRRLIRTSNDEIIKKCFTYMTDGVLKVVADETISPQQGTLFAYTLALQRSIQTRNGNLQMLLQRLNAYWELLGLYIRKNPKFVQQDEVAFVSILLKNRDILKHALPEEFIQQVWERLQSAKISMLRTPLVMLCLCVTEINEYKWIVETLCNRLKICELNEVADMAMLWSLIVEVHVSTKKLIILGDGLMTACCEFTRLSKLMTSSCIPAICQYKSTIIYFMLTVAKTKQIRITPGMIDQMFEAVNDIKPEDPDGIQMGLTLLITMLHMRAALIVDRIPPFLQRFRFLMTTVAAICHVSEKSPTQVWLPYVKSAAQIERLSQKIVQHANDFARVAPNIICHLMSCLEKYTLPSVIKMHYINSVYAFLSICDKHGIEYVNRLMPEPSSEMFKTLYNNYIKFYKFSGNV